MWSLSVGTFKSQTWGWIKEFGFPALNFKGIQITALALQSSQHTNCQSELQWSPPLPHLHLLFMSQIQNFSKHSFQSHFEVRAILAHASILFMFASEHALRQFTTLESFNWTEGTTWNTKCSEQMWWMYVCETWSRIYMDRVMLNRQERQLWRSCMNQWPSKAVMTTQNGGNTGYWQDWLQHMIRRG
jgi:hypothetical protein